MRLDVDPAPDQTAEHELLQPIIRAHNATNPVAVRAFQQPCPYEIAAELSPQSGLELQASHPHSCCSKGPQLTTESLSVPTRPPCPIRGLLANGRCSQAVLDFLSTTDVGRLVPAGEDAASEVSG